MTRWGVPDVQDEKMWKQLKRTVHPDATGRDTTELFTWVAQLEEWIRKPKPKKKKKVAAPPKDADAHAARLAHLGNINYHTSTGRLLSVLDKWTSDDANGSTEPATHTQLDAMAHIAGITNVTEDEGMVKFCRRHTLTQAEASCILTNYKS